MTIEITITHSAAGLATVTSSVVAPIPQVTFAPTVLTVTSEVVAPITPPFDRYVAQIAVAQGRKRIVVAQGRKRIVVAQER